MTDSPDIIIVESCRPKPGDLVILNTHESLSKNVIEDIRGRLAEEFDSRGIDFVIVCGASLIHLTKEELVEYYHSNRTA